MSVHLGKDCDLYRIEFPSRPVLMKNVRDVTLNMESGETDVSTRANQDWRSFLPTLKEATLEFEMLVDSSNANYTAIRSAFLLGEEVKLSVADADGVTIASFYGVVTGFSNSQPLEEGDSVNVTIRRTRSY